ncbi:DDE_3 domain-containing protein [Trichonephila clavipes]|nr:DDE_3 domain-containing protein [Trichonephila clavipes]
MFKKRTSATKVLAELNQHLDSPVSMITVRRNLQKQNIYGKAAIPKSLATQVDLKRRRVHIWKTSAQAYNREFLLPTDKSGDRSVMPWAAMSWFSAGPIVILKGRIPGKKNTNTLPDQVHPMMQTSFPAGEGTL